MTQRRRQICRLIIRRQYRVRIARPSIVCIRAVIAQILAYFYTRYSNKALADILRGICRIDMQQRQPLLYRLIPIGHRSAFIIQASYLRCKSILIDTSSCLSHSPHKDLHGHAVFRTSGQNITPIRNSPIYCLL